MGLSWINNPCKQMKCDIKENNHHGWLNKGPRYNTAKMLGLNSFITIIKLDKKFLWRYENVVQTNTNYEIQTT